MLKIKNLTKSFSSNIVLKDVDLEIEEGKLTTLLGINGSGKSTLLNILSGFELPDSGKVTYKDESLSRLSFRHKHDIFFVHEKLNYSFPITIMEYINSLKEGISKWDQDFFDEMVKNRKIDLNNNFLNLSRGQKMQVALMIGLASRAKVLLLDEITSVIDIYGRKYFLDILQKYVKEGNTVVITTNIINELEFYTDKLVVIRDKKIELNKSVEDIPKLFRKIRKTIDCKDVVFDNKECVWAGVNSDKSISYIIPIETYESFKVSDQLLDRRKSTLEDVFIYYFSQEKNMENNK